MTKRKANMLLLLAAVLWGSGNVAQQTVLAHVGPLLATSLKCFIGALVVAPFLLRQATVAHPLPRSSRLPVVITVLSFTLANCVAQAATGYTTVTKMGFFVNTAPVLVPLIMMLCLRHRTTPLSWIAALVAIAGVWMMAGGSVHAINFGDMLSLASALFYAVWMIGLGLAVQQSANAALVSLVQFCVAGVLCAGVAFVCEANSLENMWRGIPELLYLGVFSTGVAFLLQAVAQKKTSPCEAAIIVSGEAFFGAIAAYVWLGERFEPLAAFGACLIGLSILTVQLPVSATVPNIGSVRAHKARSLQ